MVKIIVTDVKWKDKKGKEQIGYYMQGYLKENLDGIPDYLDKKWDVVGIYSGHGKVRIGKSTKAFQDAYYIAWRLAGGRMDTIYNEKTRRWEIKQIVKPNKPVRFDLYENVIFKPEHLISTAIKLHKKYGKNQVIVYDEGREGLDSRVMDNINKIMEDFFQKCGYMGHVIMIVLPNFFKLHEDYAVSRSLYLIDCFADKQKRRGYFNFYDERQKEWLYFLGKKRIGITQKYSAARESFWGKFTRWMPFDLDEYNALKEKNISEKSLSQQEKKWKKQRDISIYILCRERGLTYQEIAEKMQVMSGYPFKEETIKHIVMKVSGKEHEAD